MFKVAFASLEDVLPFLEINGYLEVSLFDYFSPQ